MAAGAIPHEADQQALGEPRARGGNRLIPSAPGITAKLFLAVLAASIVVVLAMGVASRVSFTRGFLGYLNEQGVERMAALLPPLTEAYREHGDWEFLRATPRVWFSLLRQAGAQSAAAAPGSRPEPALRDLDLTGVNLRVTLLDAERRFVIGQPEIGPDAVLRAIEVDGHMVGWLALLPFQRVSAAADVRFQERQIQAGWAIGGISVLLAAVVALILARTLMAPVKRIAWATHRLAAGDYASRVAVSSRDEIGHLAEDFNQLAHSLERNEQMRRAFMADVSHELRTPLAVLRGELEALEDGVRPLTRQSLQSLQGEVATLSKLVSDLYDLSLSDAGALAYRKEELDLCELLRTTLGGYRERLLARQIRLQTALPAEPQWVSADQGRLRQLFGNLLENAIRYADPGGCLQVRCQRREQTLHIDFEDSGPGVPEALLPRLFERFYRVERSRSRASGGAGLGLAICRNIVQAHGGWIEARPSPSGGLWIAIALPLARS